MSAADGTLASGRAEGSDRAWPALGRASPRHRLFVKYAVLFVGLVGAALLINNGFDFWFSYQENKAALVRVQQEKARGAAARIAEFVSEIERQIGWTLHAQWARSPLDQRRQDYFRLLRQVPAITELVQLDADGKEQLKVSRVSVDVIGSGADFSQSPAFTEANADRVWFSPVYFHKQSEPYMTLALRRDGRNAGVTVAEINLKLILDVISGLKIGQGGYAYVVDGRGRLVAHPDISLVLRETDLSRLPQVAAALTANDASADAAGSVATATNLAGKSVLTAHASIAPLGWKVIVEVPLKEAFAPLYSAAFRSLLLLLFGLVAATVVALMLARRMTGPIRAIAAGAAQIGAGDLDRRLDIHTGDELEGLADQFNRMAADLQTSYTELEQRVIDRTAQLSESLDFQTATSEVLKFISRSTFDLQAILQTVADTAIRLCRADQAAIFRNEGGEYRWAAGNGNSPEYEEIERELTFRPGQGTLVGRTALERRTVQIVDAQSDPLYELKGDAEIGGIRTLLGVPLMREGQPIGVIGLARRRVEAFTDKQIELVQTFADQAVIAIENARLISETREALEQQTATAEVLGVINASPGDLAPVFEAMLERATRLCEGSQGVLWTVETGAMRPAAMFGVTPEFGAFLQRGATPGPLTPIGRILQGERVVNILDLEEDDSYRAGDPLPRAAVEVGGFRSMAFVALVRDETLLGAFAVARQIVRPFTEKQIALLQNFAAQAVIAMESARLITETREALEQQTATAEVLGVINASPGDLAPVFDAILDKAHSLCGAELGVLLTFDGESFWVAAAHGASARLREATRHGFRPGPGNPFGRAMRGEKFVQIEDVADLMAQGLDDPELRIAFEIGIRTFLVIPLRKDGKLLGAISANRREVRPFTEKQIALLQNFAAQAVIAMENARLITETREALEQQTATAEVLGVINASPGELAPVFDAVLEKAMRLCTADFGVFFTYDGERLQAPAVRGATPEYAEFLATNELAIRPDNMHGRMMAGENIIHIPDVAALPSYAAGEPMQRAFVDLGGGRTVLGTCLRKDGAFLGEIVIYRREVRSFSEKEIRLLQNFAAQAVIAMENARLLEEIRQRQQELRVTFDNMADGVAMFDEHLRLAAWNKNFQELLDLPDAVLDRRPDFDGYIRYLAERGEFGDTTPQAEIARLRARFHERYSFERTRPDGRVVEVRHNPMPAGGTVLIYSDITERKRAEAEIRAARDAAEAALRELKTAQASLIQAEKMASLGQLTAGIAHEIKNPLNFVNNFASLSIELLEELKDVAEPAVAALDQEKREELDDTIGLLTGNLEKIAEHGRRADNIVKSMLEHSRGASGERRGVDVNVLVDEALNLAYHGARAQDPSFNITLERDFDPALKPIELAPQDITRVFINLFGNGFYAANKRARGNGPGNGGEAGFRPVLHVATRDAGDAVEVKVRDNGTGIPREIREKLFQPFFTTKPTGEGTGLGLSISYDIVTQQHGGTIAVDSEEGVFTEFTIRLPRSGAGSSVSSRI